MILKFVVIFGIFEAVSTRGFRSEKDQLYVDDTFTEITSKTHKTQHGGGETNLLEKGKPGSDGGVEVVGHHPVEEESDKRRKFSNGRNFQTVNASLEFLSVGKENETWKVEKKEKKLDLDKEVIKTCQMTTEELVATAQSTVTRALKGLCSSKEINDRFEDLESFITTQLNTIKRMIFNLEDRLGEHGDAILYGQKQLSAVLSKSGNGNGNGVSTNNDFNNKNQKSHDYSNGKEGDGSDEEEEDVTGTRDPEILKFNSSIHMESSLNGPRKVFSYYWKINDMMFKLTGWNPRKSLRSQSFYIFPSGYRMYMRIFPRKNEDNFYVRVGLTKGEFDDTLKWPFPLEHKILILDQTKEKRVFEDIASRIWDPNLLCNDFNWQKPIKGDNHECVEIGFPHDVLKQREYIRKDALIIKLKVYLES